MQWIDALGYEEVMTFLRSTPANLFFKDTECRYLFISDVRTFFPYGEGQEEDVLGKTDLEIWSSEEQARFYYEQDQKVLATGKGTSFITEVPRKDGTAYYQIKKNLYGDNVIEKHGINRDSTGDREKTRYLCGKQGIFTRDRALIRPGFIRQLETRASTRSASFFHALGSPGRPHNGGGEAGAYRTRNGAKPLKQGHLRAKRGPLGPSRKSQQQTKRTGFAAHGHSIAETAPEGKRASCANGALIRA
nr:MAG TPA: PAS fold [Caudoviricetes sp.]